MSRSMNSNNRKKKTEADEVEELLRAAEDDVFIKLSINSHMGRGSSTRFIDPDLDQRFQSLKSKDTPKNKNPSIPQEKNPSASTTTPSLTRSDDSGGDLFARFAALKSSLPSSASTSVDKQQAPVVENINEDDDEDEVEKVIKWAIDAARLDPSPPSDTDDDNHSSSDDAEEDENSDVDDKVKRAKTKAKQK